MRAGPLVVAGRQTMTDVGPESQHEKYKGPVVMRRNQVDGTTTDQRLLDSRGPSDWVHADPWRGVRIQAGFVEGFGAPAGLGPAGGGFGSAPAAPPRPGGGDGGGGGREV